MTQPRWCSTTTYCPVYPDSVDFGYSEAPADQSSGPCNSLRSNSEIPLHTGRQIPKNPIEPRQERGDGIRHKDTAALEILTRFGPAWSPSDFPGFTFRRVYQFLRTCGPKKRVPRRKRYPQRTQSPTGSTQAIPIVLRNGMIRRVQEHKICSFQSLYRGVPVCLSKKELDVSRHTNIRRRRVLCRDTVRVIEQDYFDMRKSLGEAIGDQYPTGRVLPATEPCFHHGLVANVTSSELPGTVFPFAGSARQLVNRCPRVTLDVPKRVGTSGHRVCQCDQHAMLPDVAPIAHLARMVVVHPCPATPAYPPGRCSSRTARNSLVGLQAGHSSVVASLAPRW